MKNICNKSHDRVEVWNASGTTITTLWPERRDLMLFFAETIAREYNLSMHTHQLSDGVAIQLSPRQADHAGFAKMGLDQEVTLTLRNGKMERTFRMSESELSFNRIDGLWGMMGYEAGCSTGGDKWSISREQYVPPEIPVDVGKFLARFTTAVTNREPVSLLKYFDPITYLPSNENSKQHDRVTNVEATRRFLQDYAADEIVLCSYTVYGPEGKAALVLAGHSNTGTTKEWFLQFWIVKRDGELVITQINREPNFWLHGYKEVE